MIAEAAGRADVEPVAHEPLGGGGGGLIRSVDTTFWLWAALGGAAAFELGIELQLAKAAGQAQ